MLYLGGASVCSRNSSILMKSVFNSLLYTRKGGLVPGAKSFSSSGFLWLLKISRVRPLDKVHIHKHKHYIGVYWFQSPEWNMSWFLLPGHVNSSHIEFNSFKPEDHKKALAKGTVSNTLPITSSLLR